MKRIVGITLLLLLVSMALLAAQRGQPVEQVIGDPLSGALIYDNWILVLDREPPEGDHPLWSRQDFNKRSGVGTWRCSTCHGWDYKGADGAYGLYSTNYTGFPGLQRAVGASHEQVLSWLNGSQNSAHNFLGLTNASALNDLAAFLRTQQVDMDLLIDPETGASLGDTQRGQALYAQSCTFCHGEDGQLINFGTQSNPLYLGDRAVAEPWQTMHKIRFGTPTDSPMPAYESMDWSLRMMADVLAYAQSLPLGNPDYLAITSASSRITGNEQQAEMELIVWAAGALMALLALNIAGDIYFRSKTK
ncbi:MAG: c-type cytochrome [Anaerolineales bacterium]|nr:c-type cytochrome [Anaerolineales bacterium]